MSDTCDLCGVRTGHPTAVEAARCRIEHERRQRVEGYATEYTPLIPWAPVNPVQTFDLYAHHRSRGMTDEHAEDAVRTALELGWRPYAPMEATA